MIYLHQIELNTFWLSKLMAAPILLVTYSRHEVPDFKCSIIGRPALTEIKLVIRKTIFGQVRFNPLDQDLLEDFPNIIQQT